MAWTCNRIRLAPSVKSIASDQNRYGNKLICTIERNDGSIVTAKIVTFLLVLFYIYVLLVVVATRNFYSHAHSIVFEFGDLSHFSMESWMWLWTILGHRLCSIGFLKSHCYFVFFYLWGRNDQFIVNSNKWHHTLSVVVRK